MSRRLLPPMSDQSREPGRRWCVLPIVGLVAVLSFTGCWKKSGDAVVLGKDYVPARAVETPNESSPSPSPAPAGGDETAAADIAVYEATGPEVDPRATTEEQWIVRVEMVDDLRKIDVRVDQPQWNTLKEGDRVRVAYRQGKYTGTVWYAEITERLPAR
jgi:hypothetical protein